MAPKEGAIDDIHCFLVNSLVIFMDSSTFSCKIDEIFLLVLFLQIFCSYENFFINIKNPR